MNRKKEMSLMKNRGVTLMCLIVVPSCYGVPANVVRAITTVQMKKVPPTNMQTALSASLPDNSSPAPAAAIEPNTSGAPLPKARSVTPASDSGMLNLSTKYSRHGER